MDMDYNIQQQINQVMEVEAVNDTVLRGRKRSAYWAYRQDLYFYAVFSKPFTYTLYTDTVQENDKQIPVCKMLLHFETAKDEQVLAKFNADGSEGRMCGNGVRCVAEYLFRHGYASGTAADVETLSGVKHIVRREPGLLTVDMGAPELAPEKIPVTGFAKPVVNELVEVNGGAVRMTCVSMGNPHCVVYVSDTAGLNLPVLGGAMEHSKWFPEGVNTEFIQILDETHLKMRVWERGSGETMACGTGACAAVVASVLNGHCKKDTDVDVLLLGGTLTIRYTGDTVLMTGNAVEVFTGTVEV